MKSFRHNTSVSLSLGTESDAHAVEKFPQRQHDGWCLVEIGACWCRAAVRSPRHWQRQPAPAGDQRNMPAFGVHGSEANSRNNGHALPLQRAAL